MPDFRDVSRSTQLTHKGDLGVNRILKACHIDLIPSRDGSTRSLSARHPGTSHISNSVEIPRGSRLPTERHGRSVTGRMIPRDRASLELSIDTYITIMRHSWSLLGPPKARHQGTDFPVSERLLTTSAQYCVHGTRNVCNARVIYAPYV